MDKNCCHHHNCIEELKSDHKNILKHLDDLEVVINQPAISREKIKEFLHFTETFAEPHHQKEEQVLFPALEKKGMPNEGGPIGMMLMEHTTKRDYLVKIREALEENNDGKLKENTQAMISLLREHIYKEDNILYPCAEDILTKEELAGLASQCEKIKK
ncbi:MAG: hemerythrin domain-containing protein [Candidatus Staskawiczbacteria bacterium]|nr:hemerythrin domain-containing protein [Candidatus Staskawiczbacteria bacterium]